MCEWNRDQVTHLINFYRDLPALWDVRHVHYKDRDVKMLGYQTIVEQMKDVGCTVNVEGIKKKMHTLQNQMNRELKAVRDSKHSGAGTDAVYHPKLWFFKLFKFAKENKKDIIPSRSTLDSASVEQSEDILSNAVVEKIETVDEPIEDTRLFEDTDWPSSSTSTKSILITPRIPITPTVQTSKRKRYSEMQSPGLQLDETTLSRLTSLPAATKTDSHVFGEMVGIEMSSMTQTQRKYAKKLIFDVLMKGGDEILSEHSQVVDNFF